MYRTRFTLVLTTLVLVLALAASPALAKKKQLVDIPLEWKPTNELGDYETVDLTGMLDVTIQVGEFTDDRDDKKAIGENREDADQDKILPVSTKDDVAAWSADHVTKVLGMFGMKTTDKDGDVVLSADVRRFFVTETNTYESDVAFTVTLKDGEGEVLWQGLVGGTASRFGRSYKAENYYETISDALMNAVHDFLTDDSVRTALTR
ncbi:MAG: hypothetical protein AAGD38_23690 [Acidobacteriota bacterium]